MKKILLLSLIALGLFAVPLAFSVEQGQVGVLLASADDGGSGQGDPPRTIPQEGQLLPTITVVGNWLFSLLMAVAAIAIVIAAFLFVTSGGDPEKVATARMWIIYALAGVIVALLSQVLVNWAGEMVQE